tara:strand:- start:447 stop:929 length:483 start_codon:yes stop_codon:yes gene_type:complete
MNQVFAGSLALIIAFILWSKKKQSNASTVFKSNQDYISKAQVLESSLVIDKRLKSKKSQGANHNKSKILVNQTPVNSIKIKKKLNKLISGNPNDRLLAIQIASQWDNSKALPFLKRGLKDSDSRVVIASASGILSYKGKTFNLNAKSQAFRPPRNVSLMR